MRRREFIALLGSAAVWPVVARAAESRVRRVGILLSAAATETEYQGYLAGFVQEMQHRGWTEGKNLQMDVCWNAGDATLSQTYAAQLVGLMPDVIVAGSTVNLMAIRQATNTIPIVFVQVADPLGQGFVSDMRQPGGKITGFSLFEFSLGGKWLSLLKEIAPDLKRVAVLFNPGTLPYFKFFQPVLDAAAPPLGVQVITVPLLTESEIEPRLAEFAREPGGGLMLLGDSFTRLRHKEIAELAGRYRLPSIAPTDLASAGGLMDYGPNFDLADHYRQAAAYVDRYPEGRSAWRPACSDANEVQARHQSEDREGARP